MIRRREFLQSAALLSALSATGLASAAEQPYRGPARPFDYAVLKGRARALASKTVRAAGASLRRKPWST